MTICAGGDEAGSATQNTGHLRVLGETVQVTRPRGCLATPKKPYYSRTIRSLTTILWMLGRNNQRDRAPRPAQNFAYLGSEE
jgi:hypothetical protein